MDRFECDVLHDEKWLRSCEEFGSLSENRLTSFDQQAICIGWLFPEHQKGGHVAAFSEARIIA